MLSHRAVNNKLDELLKQKRRNVLELAKINAELQKELKAAKKTNAWLKKAAGENGQGTKRIPEERGSSSGSRGS